VPHRKEEKKAGKTSTPEKKSPGDLRVRTGKPAPGEVASLLGKGNELRRLLANLLIQVKKSD